VCEGPHRELNHVWRGQKGRQFSVISKPILTLAIEVCELTEPERGKRGTLSSSSPSRYISKR